MQRPPPPSGKWKTRWNQNAGTSSTSPSSAIASTTSTSAEASRSTASAERWVREAPKRVAPKGGAIGALHVRLRGPQPPPRIARSLARRCWRPCGRTSGSRCTHVLGPDRRGEQEFLLRGDDDVGVVAVSKWMMPPGDNACGVSVIARSASLSGDDQHSRRSTVRPSYQRCLSCRSLAPGQRGCAATPSATAASRAPSPPARSRAPRARSLFAAARSAAPPPASAAPPPRRCPHRRCSPTHAPRDALTAASRRPAGRFPGLPGSASRTPSVRGAHAHRVAAQSETFGSWWWWPVPSCARSVRRHREWGRRRRPIDAAGLASSLSAALQHCVFDHVGRRVPQTKSRRPCGGR